MKNLSRFVLSIGFALLTSLALAAPPQTINYQGYLATNPGGAPVNTTVGMTFKFYNAAIAGSLLHTELQPSVTVTNGNFNVLLGSPTPIPLPFDVPYWLTVTVAGDPEMSPRQPLASSPYAFRAATLDNAANFFFMQGGNAFAATGALGTTSNQALELQANGARVMRFEPDAISPKVIGGSPANIVGAGVRGATIAGGGSPVGVVDPAVGSAGGPNQVTDLYGTVGGGWNNRAGASVVLSGARWATVGGGGSNIASAAVSTIGGGSFNNASGDGSTVAGGFQGAASGDFANVAGGQANFATSAHASVGGGTNNFATGSTSSVGGGGSNRASGSGSSVSGGSLNTASGNFSTVGGGFNNTASGSYSFAAGRAAKTQTVGGTVHTGAFVWADNGSVPGLDFYSTANNEFSARATGGVRFVTSIDGTATPTRTLRINPNAELEFGLVTRQMLNLFGNAYGIGVQDFTVYQRTSDHFAWYRGGAHSNSPLNAGGGTTLMTLSFGAVAPTPAQTGIVQAQAFTVVSDRNVKEAFAAVDGAKILAALVRMPMQSWKYRNESNVRHIGPTAQDFHAAFGVGYDDKTIATVDADGVALAAIQGLNHVVNEKDAEIRRQRARIELLEQALAAIQSRLGMR